MKKELVNYKEAIAIIVLFEVGEFSILASGFSAKKDVWISVIIATVFSLMMVILYVNLLKLYPNSDFLDIIINIFGKKLGKILIAMYAVYCFDLTSLILLDALHFITVTSFDKTPRILPAGFMIILCVWVCKKGINILAKISRVSAVLLYGYIIITAIILLQVSDVRNLQPILYNGSRHVIKGTFELIVYPYGEILMFLIVLLHLYEAKKVKKILYSSVLLSGIYMFIMSSVIIMVIGENYASSLTFIAYGVAKHIKLGFLKRSEIWASTMFTLGMFIKISVYLMATGMCVQKVFNLKSYKIILMPLMLLSLTLINFNFDSIMTYNEYIFEIYIYYAFLFLIIVPVLIYLAGLIKKHFKKKRHD
ncbi:endospore germination permease [Clostridiaceae bacterium M8S5]|nr:endospore germination permease [Clostridiaceae bacterium M8S5]